MRAFSLLLAASLALPATGQSPISSTKEVDGATLTLRASARLVSVDVVVTDSHGNAVTGLTKADFSVLENKSQQQINSFEEHRGSATTPASVLEPGTFTNAIAVRGSAANILCLTGLTLHRATSSTCATNL